MTYGIPKEIKNRAEGKKGRGRILFDLGAVSLAVYSTDDQTYFYGARTRQQECSVDGRVVERAVERAR